MTALETPFIRAAVSLACGIVIVFGILGIGRLSDRPHKPPTYTEGNALGDGLRWCFNDTFGNACWR